MRRSNGSSRHSLSSPSRNHFAGAVQRQQSASDGSAIAAKFRGARTHRQIPDAGYNLPQEAPRALLDAVMKLMKAR
jgi:hypothetical protein